MLDLNGFTQSFKMYDPLAKRVSFYGTDLSLYRNIIRLNVFNEI